MEWLKLKETNRTSNRYINESFADYVARTSPCRWIRKTLRRYTRNIREERIRDETGFCSDAAIKTREEARTFPRVRNLRVNPLTFGIIDPALSKFTAMIKRNEYEITTAGANMILHMLPAGEPGIPWKDIVQLGATTITIAGRTRPLANKIRESMASYPYQIDPFVVRDEPDSVSLKGKMTHAPLSAHVSKQKWDAMIAAGWNRTVLPKFSYVVGSRKYSLPELPSYSSIVQVCTCTNKKSPAFRILDSKSSREMSNAYTETCPVNLLYALIGRQASIRVSPDQAMMDEYRRFSCWFYEEVICMMKESGFEINWSLESIEEYLQHVESKDKKKAEKYREAFDKDINAKNIPTMFVKCGENQVVHTGERWTTKDDVKPRFINCPDFTVRARVGYVSYNVLKWFKATFKEFFLGLTPEKLEKVVSFLDEYVYTYESDFSMFDSTNCEFMRLCNDTTFFDKAVNAQIIKPYRKAGVKKSDNLRTRQRDKMFYANVKAPFTMAISAKIRTTKRGPTRCPALAPKRICVFKGKGLLIGTTYSGHPTCTTLMGTSRNMNIHLFGIWRRRNTFSFGVRLANLPTKNFIDDDGAIYAMPRLKDVLEVIRVWILMMFAGDDTGIAFKV